MTIAFRHFGALRRLVPVLALVVAAYALALGGPARAEPGRVLTHWATGLAIGGYDPVAYFTEMRARVGAEAYEANWGGARWRFANEGNRQAFLRDPEVYAPRFGGRSVLAVARGFPGNADPRRWTIFDGRLYLFQNARQVTVFALEPARFAAAAEARWPSVARMLAP